MASRLFGSLMRPVLSDPSFSAQDDAGKQATFEELRSEYRRLGATDDEFEADRLELGGASKPAVSGSNVDSLITDVSSELAGHPAFGGKAPALQKVSGYRSKEKQAELYNNFQSGKSAIPAARPGTSKHEMGTPEQPGAIDLNMRAFQPEQQKVIREAMAKRGASWLKDPREINHFNLRWDPSSAVPVAPVAQTDSAAAPTPAPAMDPATIAEKYMQNPAFRALPPEEQQKRLNILHEAARGETDPGKTFKTNADVVRSGMADARANPVFKSIERFNPDLASKMLEERGISKAAMTEALKKDGLVVDKDGGVALPSVIPPLPTKEPTVTGTVPTGVGGEFLNSLARTPAAMANMMMTIGALAPGLENETREALHGGAKISTDEARAAYPTGVKQPETLQGVNELVNPLSGGFDLGKTLRFMASTGPENVIPSLATIPVGGAVAGRVGQAISPGSKALATALGVGATSGAIEAGSIGQDHFEKTGQLPDRLKSATLGTILGIPDALIGAELPIARALSNMGAKELTQEALEKAVKNVARKELEDSAKTAAKEAAKGYGRQVVENTAKEMGQEIFQTGGESVAGRMLEGQGPIDAIANTTEKDVAGALAAGLSMVPMGVAGGYAARGAAAQDSKMADAALKAKGYEVATVDEFNSRWGELDAAEKAARADLAKAQTAAAQAKAEAEKAGKQPDQKFARDLNAAMDRVQQVAADKQSLASMNPDLAKKTAAPTGQAVPEAPRGATEMTNPLPTKAGTASAQNAGRYADTRAKTPVSWDANGNPLVGGQPEKLNPTDLQRALEDMARLHQADAKQVSDAIAAKTPKPTETSDPVPAEGDMLSAKEYQKRLSSAYFDENGDKIASSRTTPAGDLGLKVGMWRVDDSSLNYGREVAQLRVVDPGSLVASENAVDSNSEGRREDSERYAQWSKDGKSAPPIEVVETEDGKLKIVDGHRRAAAAKTAGVPLLAWVSPSMDVPAGENGSVPRYDGDPSKPVIKTGLTYEAWRDGKARRTAPLSGGFAAAIPPSQNQAPGNTPPSAPAELVRAVNSLPTNFAPARVDPQLQKLRDAVGKLPIPSKPQTAVEQIATLLDNAKFGGPEQAARSKAEIAAILEREKIPAEKQKAVLDQAFKLHKEQNKPPAPPPPSALDQVMAKVTGRGAASDEFAESGFPTDEEFDPSGEWVPPSGGSAASSAPPPPKLAREFAPLPSEMPVEERRRARAKELYPELAKIRPADPTFGTAMDRRGKAKQHNGSIEEYIRDGYISSDKWGKASPQDRIRYARAIGIPEALVQKHVNRGKKSGYEIVGKAQEILGTTMSYLMDTAGHSAARAAIYHEEFGDAPSEMKPLADENGAPIMHRGRAAEVVINGKRHAVLAEDDAPGGKAFYAAPVIANGNAEAPVAFPTVGSKRGLAQTANQVINKSLTTADLEGAEVVEPYAGGLGFTLNLDVIAKNQNRVNLNSWEPEFSDDGYPVKGDEKFLFLGFVQSGDQRFIEAARMYLESVDSLSKFNLSDEQKRAIKGAYRRANGSIKNADLAKQALPKMVELLQRKNAAGEFVVKLFNLRDTEFIAQMRDRASSGVKMVVVDDSNYSQMKHDTAPDQYEGKGLPQPDGDYLYRGGEEIINTGKIISDSRVAPTRVHADKRGLYKAVIGNGGVVIATNNFEHKLVRNIGRDFGSHAKMYVTSRGGQNAYDRKANAQLSKQSPEYLTIISQRFTDGTILEARPGASERFHPVEVSDVGGSARQDAGDGRSDAGGVGVRGEPARDDAGSERPAGRDVPGGIGQGDSQRTDRPGGDLGNPSQGLPRDERRLDRVIDTRPAPFSVGNYDDGRIKPVSAAPESSDKFIQNHPLLRAILDNGGIAPKRNAHRLSREYDDAPSAQLLGPVFNKAIFRDDGLTPDRMAQRLLDAGVLLEPTVSAMWREIGTAAASYRSSNAANTGRSRAEQTEAEWDAENTENIPTSALNPGDMFAYQGTWYTVVGMDDMGYDVVDSNGGQSRHLFEEDSTGFIKIDKGTFDAYDPNVYAGDDAPPGAEEQNPFDESGPKGSAGATSKAPIFFSPLTRVVAALSRKNGMADEWRAELGIGVDPKSGKPRQPKAGVKPDEVKWTGLDLFLDSHDLEFEARPISKADIVSFLAENNVRVEDDVREGKQTAYGGYTLPGGGNYRELLIKIPRSASKADWTEYLRDQREDLRIAERDLAEVNEHIVETQGRLDEIHRKNPGVADGDLSGLSEFKKKRYKDIVSVIKKDEMRKETLEERIEELRDRIATTEKRLGKSGGVQAPWKSFKDSAYRHFTGDRDRMIMHIRFNERTDADGKKVLFIEEIQSDHHQEGRKKGYRGDKTPEQIIAEARRKFADVVRSEMGELPFKVVGSDGKWNVVGPDGEKMYRSDSDDKADMTAAAEDMSIGYFRSRRRMSGNGEMSAIDQALDECDFALRGAQSGIGVTPAPWAKTWHELAFKRALRWAAENGFDRVAWTPGDVQNDRYDLSKQISKVQWSKSSGKFVALDKTGYPVIEKKGVSEADLVDLIGKDIAEKLVNAKTPSVEEMEQKTGYKLEGAFIRWRDGSVSEFDSAEAARSELTRQFNLDHRSTDDNGDVRVVSGLDLRQGGEGMRGFYDKMLPDFVKKYVKQWGATVGETKVGVGDANITEALNFLHRDDEVAEDVAEYLVDYMDADPMADDFPKENQAALEAAGVIRSELESGSSVNAALQKAAAAYPKYQDMFRDLFKQRRILIDVDAGYQSVPSVDITPAMRESVMTGQPMFARGKMDENGRGRSNEKAGRRESGRGWSVGTRMDGSGQGDSVDPDSLSDAEHLDILKAHLEQSPKNSALAASLQVADSLSDIHQEIRSVFRSLFGKRVVFFRSTAPNSANQRGFFSPYAGDTLFVNVDSNRSHMAVTGHELLHSLREESPELYNRLFDVASKEMRGLPEFKSWLEEVLNGGVSNDYAGEELLANFVGDRMMDVGFWQKIAKADVGILDRIVGMFQKIVAKFREFFGGGNFGSSRFFRDIRQAEQTAADVLREYSDRRRKMKESPLGRALDAIAIDKSGRESPTVRSGHPSMDDLADVLRGKKKPGDVKFSIGPDNGNPVDPLLKEKTAGRSFGETGVDVDGKPFVEKVKDFFKDALTRTASEKSLDDSLFQSALAADPLGAQSLEEIDREMKLITGDHASKVRDAELKKHIRNDNDRIHHALSSTLDALAGAGLSPDAHAWVMKKYRRLVAPFLLANNWQKLMFRIAERVYWNGQEIVASPGIRRRTKDGKAYEYAFDGITGDMALEAFQALPAELQKILTDRAKTNEQYRQRFVNFSIPMKIADVTRTILTTTHALGGDLDTEIESVYGAAIRKLRGQPEEDLIKAGIDPEQLDIIEGEVADVMMGTSRPRLTNEQRTLFEEKRSAAMRMLPFLETDEGHYGYVHHMGFEGEGPRQGQKGYQNLERAGSYFHPWFEEIAASQKKRGEQGGYIENLVLADIAQKTGEAKARAQNEWMRKIEDRFGVAARIADGNGGTKMIENQEELDMVSGHPGAYNMAHVVLARFGNHQGQPIFIPESVYAQYQALIKPPEVSKTLENIQGVVDFITSQFTDMINTALLWHPTKAVRDMGAGLFHIVDFLATWPIRHPGDVAHLPGMLAAGLKAAASPSEWQKRTPEKFGEYSESLSYLQEAKRQHWSTQLLDKLGERFGNLPLGTLAANAIAEINLAGAGDLPLKRFTQAAGEYAADKRGLKGTARERFVRQFVNEYAFETSDLPPAQNFLRGKDPSAESKVVGAFQRTTFPFFGYTSTLARRMIVDPFTKGALGQDETSDMLGGHGRVAAAIRPVFWMALAAAAARGILPGFDDEDDSIAANLQNRTGISADARTSSRLLLSKAITKMLHGEKANEYEDYISTKGWGHPSLAHSILELVRGDSSVRDLVNELITVAPGAKAIAAVVGMEDPYSRGVSGMAQAGKITALALAPQLVRFGPDIAKIARMTLGDGGMADPKKQEFWQAFANQIGLPAAAANAVGGEIAGPPKTDRSGQKIVPDVGSELGKYFGPNVKPIPVTTSKEEAEREARSVANLAEKIEKLKRWQADNSFRVRKSKPSPADEHSVLAQLGLGNYSSVEEAIATLEDEVKRARLDGLARSLRGVKARGYKPELKAHNLRYIAPDLE